MSRPPTQDVVCRCSPKSTDNSRGLTDRYYFFRYFIDVVEEAKRQIENKRHERNETSSSATSKYAGQTDTLDPSEQTRIPHNVSLRPALSGLEAIASTLGFPTCSWAAMARKRWLARQTDRTGEYQQHLVDCYNTLLVSCRRSWIRFQQHFPGLQRTRSVCILVLSVYPSGSQIFMGFGPLPKTLNTCGPLLINRSLHITAELFGKGLCSWPPRGLRVPFKKPWSRLRVPNVGCMSPLGAHLRLAIKGKKIIYTVYSLFPNVCTYVREYYFQKSLYAYC